MKDSSNHTSTASASAASSAAFNQGPARRRAAAEAIASLTSLTTPRRHQPGLATLLLAVPHGPCQGTASTIVYPAGRNRWATLQSGEWVVSWRRPPASSRL